MISMMPNMQQVLFIHSFVLSPKKSVIVHGGCASMLGQYRNTQTETSLVQGHVFINKTKYKI